MRRTRCPTLGLACAIAVAGCLHAPMPWSPDGKWIAYTVESRPIEMVLRPGWLFEPTTTPLAPSGPSQRPSTYRLWATRKDTKASVLLEESPHPLTAPGWSPDGRALAFGRLVTPSDGVARFEVVILEGPTRRRVLSSRPLAEINAEAARLPGQAIAWSPDGRFLAIPQLNPLGLAILRADNGRQVNAIDDAFLPSWSPDGARLAFYLRGTGDTLNCLDSPLAQPRMLLDVGQGGQAPVWTRDGLTLFVAARKSVPKGIDPPGDQVELIRVRVDNGQSEAIRSLSTDVILGRDRAVEGVSIAFDGESLFCSTVIEGVPNGIAWYHPRENEVYKRFSIVDHSAPVGSLSVSPDGSTLAARVGPIDRLGPPALCDLEGQEPRAVLIAPDDPARVEWVAILVNSARTILAGLPAASVDPNSPTSKRVDRPTILPILGEFEANSDQASRLRKIGRHGRALCQRPANAPLAEPGVEALLDEARLFFDYLAEDYSSALKSLEAFEARVETPERRVALLGVRAQIWLGQGRLERAAESITFLRSLARKPARQVEWDGSGFLLHGPDPAASHGEEWPDYLTWRASKVRDLLHEEGGEFPFNPDNPRVNFGLDPFAPRANPVFPDRPFFIDPAQPEAGRRPGMQPRLRLPDR